MTFRDVESRKDFMGIISTIGAEKEEGMRPKNKMSYVYFKDEIICNVDGNLSFEMDLRYIFSTFPVYYIQRKDKISTYKSFEDFKKDLLETLKRNKYYQNYQKKIE